MPSPSSDVSRVTLPTQRACNSDWWLTSADGSRNKAAPSTRPPQSIPTTPCDTEPNGSAPGTAMRRLWSGSWPSYATLEPEQKRCLSRRHPRNSSPTSSACTGDKNARASPTVNYSLEVVRRFLCDRFAGGPVALAALGAADVIGFVQRQAAGLHPKRAKLMTTARRSFLQYARYRGDLILDLAAAVPTVAPWSMASLPRSLPPDHVERVFAQCDRQTVIGRRDDAMLLLLARLGLRAGEVVSLKLAAIDWEAGCVTVRGKGGHWSQMPLPSEVGEAIATSVQQGRPACSSRQVFMRQKAPLVGFATSIAMCTLVARALGRAGVEAPQKGAHLFRHTLATAMLRQGASLAAIGARLRHQSLQTTAISAKGDLAALRTLAAPWPGGVPGTPYAQR